jgi:hypothetical protein
MKNLLHSHFPNLLRISILVGVIHFAEHLEAQDNVWTSTTGGNWQDASWSLGLPATNHTIWLTNDGWKAVQIGADTVRNFPQSLNVNAINISSPTNTFNTLLLNYAGSATPLTVKSLTVASNSALQLFSSALQINGLNSSGMIVGGSVEQNDSVVAGNQVNVGYIGSGVYGFNSGYFTVSHLWLGGGNTPGVFIQNGGTNGFGITHLDGGTYVLSNGWYGATIYFDGFGKFLQRGGLLQSDLTMFQGTYVLAAGIHQGTTMVPAGNGFYSGSASMLQTGGTNVGTLDIGSAGVGLFTMSNGVCAAPSVIVDYGGSYSQWDGTLQVDGPINVYENQVAANYWSLGQFYVHGGQVSSTGMALQGYYAQTGGTNSIAGDVNMQNVESSLILSGGLLAMSHLTANPGWSGGVILNGGTLVISNSLNIGGASQSNWRGFSGGGTLVVAGISLGVFANFSCGDGVIKQSGTLCMRDANLYSASNSVQFGPLSLGGPIGGATNSTIYMVSPTSILKFADSSGQDWDTNSLLVIEGWTGSLFGGGSQQIIFGNDSNALTSSQLAHIQFHDPAGLANGLYPARILSNGEIVPSSGGASSASMALQPQPGGMQLKLQGEAGRTYSIETSTDLVHWVPWTNMVNSTGTMTVTDTASTNYPARFYRARLMP